MAEQSVPLIYESGLISKIKKWNVGLMVQMGRVQFSNKSQQDKKLKIQKLRVRSRVDMRVSEGDSPRSVIMAHSINKQIHEVDPLSKKGRNGGDDGAERSSLFTKEEPASMSARYKIHIISQRFCPIFFFIIAFSVIVFLGM